MHPRTAGELADKMGRCNLCHHVLTSKAHVAQGKKWCARCWVCRDCHKPIAGKYRIKDGRPQCVSCAKSERKVCGVTGAGCGQAISSGRHIKALGAFWHRDCFVCTQCGGALSGGFVVQNGKPYCSEACTFCAPC